MGKRISVISAIAVSSALTAPSMADDLDLVVITGQSLCTQYPFMYECGGSGVPGPGMSNSDMEAEFMINVINTVGPSAVKKLVEGFKPPCIKPTEPELVYIERAIKECYDWALDAIGSPANSFGSVKQAALAACQTHVPAFQEVAILRDPVCAS